MLEDNKFFNPKSFDIRKKKNDNWDIRLTLFLERLWEDITEIKLREKWKKNKNLIYPIFGFSKSLSEK